MIPDQAPTLYTSLTPDGAMAEISYYWSQLVPRPTKPVVLHKLAVKTRKTLQLAQTDLVSLGVDWMTYQEAFGSTTQSIGAAAAFLELDGLLVPSARWDCENLMLFLTNHGSSDALLELRNSEEVEWQEWMRTHHRVAP